MFIVVQWRGATGVRKEVKMKTGGRAGVMEVLASSLRGTQVIE